MPPKNNIVCHIEFDTQFECLYLQFSQEKITKTVEHSHHINIDLDKRGQIVGIEVIGLKQVAKRFKAVFAELGKAYNRPELENIPKQLKQNLAPLVA